MGITEQLARFAIETKPDFSNAALLASAKLKFLDTIAVMVGGAQDASAQIAARVTGRLGGTPDATLFCTGARTSAPLAGFVNGISAHALEYDDYTRGIGHASVCLVPGCLAMAEAVNATGRDMLDAFAVGFEITARVAYGLRPTLLNNGWHPIGIVGGQGVAVAACRLLNLDTLKTRMAMGVMASSGSGVRKNVGSMGKSFHVGHGVKSGILAALLAADGYTVDPDIIEGAEDSGEGHQRFGLADTFNGLGRHRLHLMVEGLGGELQLARDNTMIRMHPGSTAPSSTIDGVIDLATTHDLKAADVDEIIAECTPQCVAIAPYAEPSDPHRAKFCIPYSLAVALIDREVRLRQYEPARIADPEVQALSARIRVVIPDDLKHHHGQWGENGVNWGASRLTVRLRNGRVLAQDASYARGWPERPVSWQDVEDKYRECTAPAYSPAQTDETLAMIRTLETLPSVRELTRALAPHR